MRPQYIFDEIIITPLIYYYLLYHLHNKNDDDGGAFLRRIANNGLCKCGKSVYMYSGGGSGRRSVGT